MSSTLETPTGGTSPATAEVPLSRNWNYNVLWISRLISELGSEIAFIAFPLLILAVSGSAWEMGVVTAVTAAAQMVGNVPAGILADRADRRRIMIGCEVLRSIAMGSLAVALMLGHYSFWHVVVVAAVEGLLSSVFGPAEDASLPNVVPESQLSMAIARNTSRTYVANLIGPAISGVLFAVHRMIPFLFDAILLLVSAIGLSFLRLAPVAQPAEPEEGAEPVARATVREDVREGFRWVLGQRTIRATLVWVTCFQLVFSSLVIIVLALSGEADTGPGEIGLMMACFGAGGLLGSAVAARLHAAIPAPVIVLGFSWLATGLLVVMALVPAGLLMGVVLAAIAFFVPTAITTVMTYQMTITPDALRGRLSSMVGVSTGAAGALGPLAGGLLMTVNGGPTALFICAGALAVIAVGATLSPSLRRFA